MKKDDKEIYVPLFSSEEAQPCNFENDNAVTALLNNICMSFTTHYNQYWLILITIERKKINTDNIKSDDDPHVWTWNMLGSSYAIHKGHWFFNELHIWHTGSQAHTHIYAWWWCYKEKKIKKIYTSNWRRKKKPKAIEFVFVQIKKAFFCL